MTELKNDRRKDVNKDGKNRNINDDSKHRTQNPKVVRRIMQETDVFTDHSFKRRAYLTLTEFEKAIYKQKERQGRSRRAKGDIGGILKFVTFNAAEAVDDGDLNTFIGYVKVVDRLRGYKRRDKDRLISIILSEMTESKVEFARKLPSKINRDRLVDIVKNMKSIRLSDRIDSLRATMILLRKHIDMPLAGIKTEYNEKVLDITKKLIKEISELSYQEVDNYFNQLSFLDMRVLIRANLEFFRGIAESYRKNNNDMILEALGDFIYSDSQYKNTFDVPLDEIETEFDDDDAQRFLFFLNSEESQLEETNDRTNEKEIDDGIDIYNDY
ncbi:hypothetical protein J7J26_03640 [Candidatus Micrarchaeota archaeon]|nr:hypothetical protein [Candidatus Micrarchaeota archaeon]